MVAQLVAALHDERQGVVVAGRQLVAVQDDDLGAAHHLLGDTRTRTRTRVPQCDYVGTIPAFDCTV